MALSLNEINALVEKESDFVQSILSESGKVIVGQNYVLNRLLIGVLVGGHILLEGVPGLAKTLSIKTLSDVVNVEFSRIQFTPDLLPSDVIGTLIYNQTSQEFVAKLGPIFSNFVLADEINRAPAKVQSALLEAMQEKQVTIGETTFPLKAPFLVLATQNPIDQEGTYSLPEAQVDRFLMKIKVTYPSKQDEREILERMGQGTPPAVQKVIEPEGILRAREVVNKVYVDDKIKEYILDLVAATRSPETYNMKDLSPLIQYGASPRATISLLQASRAHAFVNRRGFVTPEDVKSIGKDVFRHRVVPSFEAEAEEMDSDDIVERIFSEVEVP